MQDEKLLKRFLKRKCKVTLAFVTAFLITGSLGYAEKIDKKQENTEIEYIISLKGNLKKAKNKEIDNVKYNFNQDDTTIPGIEIIPPGQEGGPTTTIPGMEIIPPGQEGGPIYKRPASNVITVEGKEQKDDKGFIAKYVTAGDITNSIDGAIISATDVGEAINKHIITNNGSSMQTGMEAINGGKVTNEGKIIVSGLGTGLYTEKGTIINDKLGTIEADMGMMIYGSGKGENNGIINASRVAVEINGTDSSFINNETGVLNGEVVVYENSKFENKGTINTSTIKSYKGAIFTNNGIINGGSRLVLQTDGTDNDNRFWDGKLVNEKGATIKADLIVVGRTDHNGGTINRGTIKGQLQGDIIDEGGNIESSQMNGNLYLTGKSVTSYDKVAVNKNINIEKLDGNVYSNSALYTAKKDGNNVAMIREDFNSLIEDKNVAGYFEDNFKEGTTIKNNLLDEIKNISSKKELEKATNNVLGNSLVPNLKIQTKEMIDFTHNSFQNAIKNSTNKDIRIIAGNDYGYKDTKSSNLTGYEDNMYNIYLGIDKEINNNLRVGTVFSVGKLDSKYDDNSKRKDTFYQAEAFATYKYQDYKLTTSILGGFADGELNRVINVGKIRNKYNSDLKTYYAGTYNTFSRNYDLGNFYIEPNAKLNVLYLNQDDIIEKGNYAIEVEKDDTCSVEAGLGVILGKEFNLKNNKLTLEASANIYHEFAEPYDSFNAKLNTISSDKYEISKYEKEDIYGDIGLKLEVASSNETVTGFIEGKVIIDDETNYESSIGLSYKF